MRPDRSSLFAGAVEWMLFAFGVACLMGYAWLSYESRRLEDSNREAVTQMLASRPAGPVVEEPDALPEPAPAPDPGLLGQLDIPRLQLSAPVRFGDDAAVLTGAVGSLPDSAFPWEDGNSVLAAHRDRLFRALANIRAGDEIRLSTRYGDFTYRVRRTFVVNPDDVWILDSAPGVDLTLVTCYPFWYVGHAPQRFVVRAERTGPRSSELGPQSVLSP